MSHYQKLNISKKPYLKDSFVQEVRKLNKKYGDSVISFVGDNEKLQKLFKPQTLRMAVKSYPMGPIDPLPNLLSLDRELLSTLSELSSTLNKELPPQVDRLGRVYGNGVRADFNGLLHLGGLPQEAATTPYYSNHEARSAKGLTNVWLDERDKQLFKAIVYNWFKKLPDVKVRLKDRSSDGFPNFNTDVVEKVKTFRYFMDNLDAIMKLQMKGDIETAYQLYGAFGPSFALFRDQVGDKISVERGKITPKERKIASVEFAASGGKAGEMLTSSKDPAIYGLDELSGKFACQRRRVAYGQSGGYSFFLLPWAQSIRKYVYDEYGFTMHHTTQEQKADKMRDWSARIPADVSDHDMLWPIDLYEPLICEVLKELGYEDWAILTFKNALRTAIYVPCNAPGQGGFMIGDYTNPDNSTGLVSGNPFTDLMGGVGMIFVYLHAQLKNTMMEQYAAMKNWKFDRFLSFTDAYMKGQLNIGCPSKSDDAYLLFRNDLVLLDRARKFHEKLIEVDAGKSDFQASPYMELGYEHGGAFLGDIELHSSDMNAKNIRFIGNINSYPLRMFLPEYPAKMSPEYGLFEPDRLKMLNRAYPGVAYKGRLMKYGDAPAFSTATDVIRHVWKKHLSLKMGMDYLPYMEKLYRDHNEMMKADLSRRMEAMVQRGLVDSRILAGNLTEQELDYINDPSKASWLYADHEIDESLQDLHYGSISESETRDYLNKINSNMNIRM